MRIRIFLSMALCGSLLAFGFQESITRYTVDLPNVQCSSFARPATPENTVFAIDFHGVIGDFSPSEAARRFWEHPHKLAISSRILSFYAKKALNRFDITDEENSTHECYMHKGKPLTEYEQETIRLINPFTINPHTEDLLRQLHKHGYKLILFSDMGIMTSKMEAARHPDFFNLFESVRVRGTDNNYASKRSDKSYLAVKEKAAEVLGKTPQNLIFIDDNRNHVKRAAKHDICGIVFSNAHQTAETLNQLGIQIDAERVKNA